MISKGQARWSAKVGPFRRLRATRYQEFLELSFGQSTKLPGLSGLQNAASVEVPAQVPLRTSVPASGGARRNASATESGS